MEIVVCVCRNNGIGFNNEIPWKTMKEDMKLFRELTLGNVVVMGRKTKESLPNGHLPDRENVVISHDPSDGESWEQAVYKIAKTGKSRRVFVIGGESIYKYALENLNVRKVHLSRIDQDFTCDTFFEPNLVMGFQISGHSVLNINERLTYSTYEKYNFEERSYLKLLDELLYAPVRKTRNANCHTLFGKTLEFDLKGGCFPLLTTKKMFLRGIFEELKFFLLGKTQTKELEEKGVNIWKGNTCKEFLSKRCLLYEEGDMGPMYGYQWRNFNSEGHDQFAKVMKNLKENPMDRRHLMTSFNPLQAEDGVLWPCHGISIQFDCEPDGESYRLHCMMHQRSADTFLGLPFNIASYSMLVIIMANMLGYKPGRLIMNLGNVHLYEQHVAAARVQIDRAPRPFPSVHCARQFDKIDDIEFSDFTLFGYEPHDKIEAPMIA
jgi:dihydrofolate reductase/thymidylate synthase